MEFVEQLALLELVVVMVMGAEILVVGEAWDSASGGEED